MSAKIEGRYIVAPIQVKKRANSLCFENPQTGIRLWLNKRKETAPKKPDLYLMIQADGQKAEYLSSLYPVLTNDTYLMDNKRALYLVTIGTDTLTISPKGTPKNPYV